MNPNNQSSQDDGVTLFQIFPEELWILILDKFDNVNMFENLSVTSQFFKPLLQPRHQFAFVWPILACYLERQVECRSKHMDFSERYVKHENLRWTMTLRLTCKLWKNTVDQFLQNLEGNWSLFSRLALTKLQYNDGQSNLVEQRKTPNKFLERFPNSKNPFPSGCVSFGFNNCRADGHAQNSNIFSLFSKYGHHIQFLNIGIFDYLDKGTKTSKTFRTLLEFTPNLKKLDFCARIGSTWNSSGTWDQLSKYIQANHLPVVSNLKTVVLGDLPYPIIQELFQTNSQIENVHGFPHRRNSNLPANCLELLKNIKKLEICVGWTPHLRKLECCPERLAVEELYLTFETYTVDMTWPRAFALVEKLGQDTLKKVYIALPQHHSGQDNCLIDNLDNIWLNLSNISELRLKVENVCNLDFLLAMSDTLRTLNISVCLREFCTEEVQKKILRLRYKTIQFWQFLDNPLSSNIWNWLNNLNCLVVDPEGYGKTEKSYFRRDYNKLAI